MQMSREEKEEIAQKILERIEEKFGTVPLVNKVLSEDPDLFIPVSNVAKAAFESEDKKLDAKTSYLCAVAAATGLGAEHCIRAQGNHAKQVGVTKDEMREAMFIGSYMAMTRAQSYAFRVLEDLYKE
ncbi:MAG: carboxymuconolactone decarboxylase family protein [Candidatus Methanomethylophilaceae archaeon]|nr:carboxymuconolactone decarboxylase family protein [Candidatus Methanomethylophilaceae archaeon]MDY5872119.1 carboxymuconolactone decarboxylase family protein [Candidatus Methanomethylophilaceae archaeon]